MSRCFIEFPIMVLGKPYIYQNLEDFKRMRGVYLETVGLCEELSGGYSKEMMG